MSLGDSSTHYDVLDTTPDASPQEVRDAYLRIKSTYTKDSAALYTLVASEEREEILRRIEEAYHVLSDPEKRREYDQNHGLLNNDFMPAQVQPENTSDNIVSIDRVPPMDQVDEEDLLIPPSTDIQAPAAVTPTPTSAPMPPQPSIPAPVAPPPTPSIVASNAPLASGAPPLSVTASTTPNPYRSRPSDLPILYASVEPALLGEVERQTEWKGEFLKKVREAYKVSLEEMAATTKISKNYLIAIEEENFSKLPAPVYLRGFVQQICRVLKLPAEKACSAYLARYNQAQNQNK